MVVARAGERAHYLNGGGDVNNTISPDVSYRVCEVLNCGARKHEGYLSRVIGYICKRYSAVAVCRRSRKLKIEFKQMQQTVFKWCVSRTNEFDGRETVRRVGLKAKRMEPA